MTKKQPEDEHRAPGRREGTGNGYTEVVSAVVTPALAKKLDAAAKAARVKRGTLVRTILEQWDQASPTPGRKPKGVLIAVLVDPDVEETVRLSRVPCIGEVIPTQAGSGSLVVRYVQHRRFEPGAPAAGVLGDDLDPPKKDAGQP